MNGYATARQNGWMSANDIRELENLDRIPAELGGDLYLINGNMTKLQDAGIFAASGKEEDSDARSFGTGRIRARRRHSRNREFSAERHHRERKAGLTMMSLHSCSVTNWNPAAVISPCGSILPAVTASLRHRSTICSPITRGISL